MRRGDYGGLWRLSLLTSCLSPLPLAMLSLLPANFEEQKVRALVELGVIVVPWRY